MTDKLSASAWTQFTKKRALDLDDAALLKALERFDKSEESKPDARLTALEGAIEQINKQITAQGRRKKELGDKLFAEIKDKLHELLDAAETLQAQTRQLIEKAKEAAKKAQAEDEDEESPALLTSKMIPLIREVRKGEVVMQALIATAGKETVVLLSRRAISPARGKLLKEQMEKPGGLKFIRGECLFEKTALTFIVQAPAAGLAKRIKAALLQQTDLRLKVRVRGEDGEDDDGEDGEDGEQAEAETEAVAGAEAGTPEQEAGEEMAAAAAVVAALKELATRFIALRGRLDELAAYQTPIGADIRKRVDDVAARLSARKPEGVAKLLDQIDQIAQAIAARKTGATEAAAGGEARARTLAEAEQLQARFLPLSARLDELDAYKTPIADDIRKRVDAIAALLGAHKPEGVAKLLDQLEQIAKAIAARKGGATSAAGQGEARTRVREAADALLKQLNDALQAQRTRLAGLTDPPLRAPVEVALALLEGQRDTAAATAGDEARTAAQQRVIDAIPAWARTLDEALATQALKQRYDSARALITADVDKADAALKAMPARFKDTVAAAFTAALSADKTETGLAHWSEAAAALPTLKGAAEAVLKMAGEAEAYHLRATALAADIATAKGVFEAGLPDGLRRLSVAWTDSAAELERHVLDKAWPEALASLEQRKTTTIDPLKDLGANGRPVLAALARLDADHKRANQLMQDHPDRFKPTMKPAEQQAVRDFDTALAVMNWGDAQRAVDALVLAIRAALDAQSGWEAFQAELAKDGALRGEVEAELFRTGIVFPAGATDDYKDGLTRFHQAKKDADWAAGLIAVQDLNIAATALKLVIDAGKVYFDEMKAFSADLNEGGRILHLNDSRLTALVGKLNGVYGEMGNFVDAGDWANAAAKVLPLRDATRALIDAYEKLGGKREFEVELGKIKGLHPARALAMRPPAGMAAALPEAFRRAQQAADTLRVAKDFGLVAPTSNAVLVDLRKAVKDLLDAAAELESGRLAFEVEMKANAELETARAIAKAAAPSLSGAIAAFNTAEAAAKQASTEGRWPAALTEARTLKTRTTELLAARGTANSGATDETWVALQRQLDAVDARIAAALATTTVPFLLTLQVGVRTPAAAAKAAITGKDRVAAEVALGTLMRDLAACEKGLADHAAHLLKLKAAAEGEVKTARAAALGSDVLNRLRTKELDITAAEIKALSDAGDIAAADKAVAAWIAEANAWLQAREAHTAMTTSGAPDKAKLSALNSLPGGGVVLDALIASLDETTTPQSVLKDALNVRYGVEVKQFRRKNPDRVGNLAGLTAVDETLPDKSLQALYDMLGDVPIEHIKDKVKELVRFTEDTGGAAYGNKKVYMYCGRADNSGDQDFGADGGVLPPGEKVDPACEPSDTRPVAYFKFAALHEVGHAEDDAGGHMKKSEIAGMAGWLKHSSDEVADVAADHFGYDLGYIRAILADKTGRPPATAPLPPSGTSASDWEAARLKAVAWCGKVRVDASLWYNPAGTKQCAINGRVYQEAYAGDWVSYSLAARAQGISSYQFRSPVEWFADLYAAYYCKKLKPSHPAMAWLSKL